MPILAPPTLPTGLLKYEWIDPGGILRDLTRQTSPNLFQSRGAKGLGAPGVQIADEKLPFLPGSVVRHIGVQPARMTIPITINQTSMANLISVVDSLHTWFDTGDESNYRPGIYRVTREDGTVRQRSCIYTGGLEGDLDLGTPNMVTLAIDLYAPDGWPTDSVETTYDWVQADFASPLAIMNAGELDAYPIWTFTGPGVGIVVNNNTYPAAWGYSASVASGHQLIVDTRPASLRTTLPVVDDTGASQFANFSVPTSKLWHLKPGLQTVSVTGTGFNANTRLSVRFLPRYRGALR